MSSVSAAASASASAPAAAASTAVSSSASSASLQALKGASASPESTGRGAVPVMSAVREAALRDTARVLGMQAGLGDESRRIIALTEQRTVELDRDYRFGDLLMGVGILPAAISRVENAVGIDGAVMRVAQSIYRIDEPARPVLQPPTWRDWLYVGLNPGLHPRPPSDQQLLPRDDQERQFWASVLDASYEQGVRQAKEIFAINMARLVRTYRGMRTFYELYDRGMVTAPEVVASSSIVNREDPNTIAVGATVFRIVAPTTFVEQHDLWRPLGR